MLLFPDTVFYGAGKNTEQYLTDTTRARWLAKHIISRGNSVGTGVQTAMNIPREYNNHPLLSYI